MRHARPSLPFLAGVAWCTLFAFFEGPLGSVRPGPPELRAAVRLAVTSEADSGPGSLRQAILAADRSRARVRIDVRVPRVRLESPLPALVNPKGVAISGDGSPIVVDGGKVSAGPLIDIASPHSVLSGLILEAAVDRAVSIRGENALLRGMEFVDCSVGVLIGEGGDGARVVESRFSRNGTGVAVGQLAAGVELSANAFAGHDRAAVWAVAPSRLVGGANRPLLVEGNRFEDDRISIVLIHVPARVERNQFARAGKNGILLTGFGVIRGNRVVGAGSVGILADAPDGARIEANEVSGAGAIGVLVRGGRETELRDNRVYSNAYGIAVVLGGAGPSTLLVDNLVMTQQYDGIVVLGAGPVLRENHILRNRAAGLRLLDLVTLQGRRRAARPVLDGNVIDGNQLDEPMRGEYRERRGPQ